MRKDQCRALGVCDDVGHSEGFTAAGYSQQGLVLVTPLNTFRKLSDRFGLVS